MAEPPKKRILTGLDISRLSRVRPTRIPSAAAPGKIHQYKIRYKRLALDAAILALIIIIAYGASLIGGFVFNDHYIDKFVAIKLSDEGFWSKLILKAIIQPLSQPWIIASFAFDLQNFGLEAIWYHIVNIILHFLACIYFYIFVYRLAKHSWQTNVGSNLEEEPLHALPMLAATLLACHPLACESVAHIAARSATITACNSFLALNFFLAGYLSRKLETVLTSYAFTFIFILLAIFSDCQGLSVPAVILLLSFLLKGRTLTFKHWLQQKWGDLIFIASLIALIPVAVLRGFSAEFSNGFALPLPTLPTYVIGQFCALSSYYLRCLLLPVGLSIYPPVVTVGSISIILAVLGLIILTLGCYLVYRLRKQPLSSFGLGLAILSFLPSMMFVQNEIAADRRFYLAIAGLGLLLADSLKTWLAPRHKNYKVRLLAALLVVIFTGVTIARTCDFRSDVALLKAAVRVNNQDPWAKASLALGLVNHRKIGAGINVAKEALKMKQSCQPAHLALGKAYLPDNSNAPGAIAMYKLAKGELEQAVSLAKSQHLSPMQLFDSEVALASALIELNEYKQANAAVSEALAFSPNSIMLNLILGRSLNGLGRYREALNCLDKVYTYDRTNPDCVEPLAEAAFGTGTASTISTAYNIARLGIRIKQSHNLHMLLAQAAFAMRQFQESIQWTDVALKEKPNDPKPMYLRSFQLQLVGRLEQAKSLRAQALKLEPDLPKHMPIFIVDKEKNKVIKIN